MRRRAGCWVLAALVGASPFVAAFAVARHEQRREEARLQAVEDEDRELAHPSVRPVLRGMPASHEVLAALARIVEQAPRTKFRIDRDPRGFERWRLDVPPEFRDPVATCALLARLALQGEACADADVATLDPTKLGTVLHCLQREAWRAAKAGRPLEATQVLLDGLRLRHDLARRADPWRLTKILGTHPDTPVMVATLLPRLGAEGLDEVLREVRLLETTFPSSGESVRRERLDRHLAFLETIAPTLRDHAGPAPKIETPGFFRALQLRDEWKRFEAEDVALAACEAEARLPLAKALALEHRTPLPPREFLREARAARGTNATANQKPRVQTGVRLGKIVKERRDLLPDDVARPRVALAALEAAVLAQAGRLRTGQWPAASPVLDPRDDRPLELVPLPDGGLGVSAPGVPHPVHVPSGDDDDDAADAEDDPSFLLLIPGKR